MSLFFLLSGVGVGHTMYNLNGRATPIEGWGSLHHRFVYRPATTRQGIDLDK